MRNTDMRPQVSEDRDYGTVVGEFLCEDLYPWVAKKVGWCLGKILLGLLFGLGFWAAQFITSFAALSLV